MNRQYVARPRAALRGAGFGEGRATFVPAGEGVPAMPGTVPAEMVIAEREGAGHRLELSRVGASSPGGRP